MTETLGPLMLDLEGSSLSESEVQLLRKPIVGGLILFARNYQSPDQLKELVASVRAIRPNILIAVDQEGGRVQRFREGFLRLPALRSIGNLYEKNKPQGLEMATTCGWAMAAELVHHGIDFSFAPVLDLFSVHSEVIKDRAFAADAESVSLLAQAYVAGMNRAGMAATGKHFPGHGTVVADSHHELPVDARSAEQILETDYQAFARSIRFLGAIMPAHVQYPSLDGGCAGYSSFWIQQKLRGELNFSGVVFSDDLTMAAAHAAGDVCSRADQALAAGCDMVLVCNNAEAARSVAQHLESRFDVLPDQNHQRLPEMAARLKEDEQLYEMDQWQAAKAAINTLLEQS